MKQVFKLVAVLSFVAHVSMVSAQVDPNTKVVVIPLAAEDGIVYEAGSQIAIDEVDGVQTIRFAPSNNGLRDNHQPSIGINHIIALLGLFPSRSGIDNPTIAEITMFGGNFAPRNWALCDGQLQSIAQNPALFSILGVMYGGDGRTTFALPDLRGRTAVHPGTGPGLSTIRIGDEFGSPTVNLN